MVDFKVDISRARLDDLQEILAIQRMAYTQEAKLYDDFQIPPLTETLEDLKDKFTSHTFLKATADGKIIGTVRVQREGNTCHVGRLAVHPDFQNRGVATKLLMEVERTFPTCGRFELFTGDRSVRDIRLYEKFGYKRFKTERPANNVNLVYLEKTR
jgi:ribosomal protein S18 acetylase RimI-like enzyme